MFSPEELQEIVSEAQAGVPQSVSMSPADLSIPPAIKAKIRLALVAAIKALFTSFTGVPLPVQDRQAP